MSDFLSITKSLSSPSRDAINRLSTSEGAKEQFLRLHLAHKTTALLPLKQLTEVLTIPLGKIVPIPHMRAWVMGVYNWRGEILWMVDLAHLVGLTPWYQKTSSASVHKAVVLRVHNINNTSTKLKSQMLGLVVNQVEDIEWCNPNGIQSPPSSTVTAELVPFLRGYWVKANGEILTVLDGEAIMKAMPIHE